MIYSDNLMIRTFGDKRQGNTIRLCNPLKDIAEGIYRIELLDERRAFMGKLLADKQTIVESNI